MSARYAWLRLLIEESATYREPGTTAEHAVLHYLLTVEGRRQAARFAAQGPGAEAEGDLTTGMSSGQRSAWRALVAMVEATLSERPELSFEQAVVTTLAEEPVLYDWYHAAGRG